MKKKKESNLPAAKVSGKSKRLAVGKVKANAKAQRMNTEATLPKKVSRGADEEME